MKISYKDANKVYLKLKDRVYKYYKKGKIDKCLAYIISASSWMYHFNLIYSDLELENIIHKIAEQQIDAEKIVSPINENVAFIDNFGFDNRGLTQQYLRGLMGLNKRILYVLHNSSPNENSEIIRELKEYGKCDILIFKTDKNNLIKTATIISKKIFDFSPKDILIHIAPWDVVTLMALSSISGAIKYNINLTDHAFWLGSSFIDYNIEFRGYGELLSLQKRNLNKSQLINLPYYPIVSKYTSFQGFPSLPEDSVIVFCGGSEYKMLGKDGIFFKLMDSILDISQKVYILVAGIKEDSVFAKNVSKMKNRDRVLLIGSRTDINEVFAHSDIYLSSYPFFGGLMTQYAAYNQLPILSYSERNDIVGKADYLVNHFNQAMNSKESLHEFKEYAKYLIENKKFREKEGQANYNAIMNEASFNKYLDITLYNFNTNIYFVPEQPNYKEIITYYIEVENKTHEALKTLIYQMNFKSFIIVPQYALDLILIISKALMKKLFNIFL